MKKGWKYVKLGEVCHSICDGDWIESKDQSPTGIRLVQTGNIGIGFYKDKAEKAKYISEETFKSLHCTEIFEGDILVSRLPDPVGRACVLPNLGNRSITAVDCSILKLKSSLVCNEWLAYYMQSARYFSLIKNQCTGSTRLRITRKKLAEVSVPLPPLSEQEEIVRYLDKAFMKIDAMKEKAEEALEEAKALFQSALTEMMTPKKGWKEKKLGEIALDMYRGSGIKRDQIRATGIPCVRYGEIYTTYDYAFDTCVSHTDEELIDSKKYFEHGDILFTITGESIEEIGKSVAYLGHEKCLLGGDLVAMKHKENPKYLSYALSTPEAIKQKGFGKTKLKVVHTNIPSLKSITIPLPPLPEQEAIVSRLDAISERVKALEENYSKAVEECDAMKQAMLREVFE